MIVTVTMNPSIDIAYQLPVFSLDQVNRTADVLKTAGGKGLNVTRVLKELGASVKATGVVGGHHGAFIQAQLTAEQIPHDFLPIQAETRNSIAVLHEGQQTEILEKGPSVTMEEQEAFLQKFSKLAATATLVTISGSLPQGTAADFYEQLIEIAATHGAAVLLDTSGQALICSLKATIKPLLIKPNTDELVDLVGERLTVDELPRFKAVLSSDLFYGIPWIVVSLGAKGALVKHENTFYRVTIPKIEAVNPVGSGDATIAGLAYGLSHQLPPQDIMKTAMATGILNALEMKTGHISISKFDHLYSQVVVTEV